MKRDLLYGLIIVGFVLFLGFLLDAWAYFPYPLGTDTLKHVYKTKFVVEHWPHIRWNHQWSSGMPFLSSYPPFPYYLMSLIVGITGFSIEFTLVLILAISYCLIGLGTYGSIYELTNNREASLVLSSLTVSTPFLWFLHVRGGVSTEVWALAFVPFSLWATTRFIKKTLENKSARNHYVTIVLLASMAVSLHWVLGTAALLSCLVITFLCIKGWRRKIYTVAKIGIPVSVLNTYAVIPLAFLMRFKEVQAGSFALSFVSRGHLYRVPSSGVDFTLSPLTWPLTVILLGISIYYKLYKQKKYLRAIGTLTSLSIIFSFFNFGEIEIWWLGFSLLPVYLMTFNGMLLSQAYDRIKKRSRAGPTLTSTLLLGIIISAILVSHVNPIAKISSGIGRGGKSFDEICQNLRIPTRETMFRVGITGDYGWSGLWFNYKYDVPQTRDYAGMDVLNREWVAWLYKSVWCSSDNYNETNFLLDWWSVKWIFFEHEFKVSKTPISLDKFMDRPDSYKFSAKFESLYNSIYQFNYSATPIVSATSKAALLILGDDLSYNNIFRSLAPSNYDSRHIIPVRGYEYVDDYTLDELIKFDAIILYGYSYHSQANAWSLLQEYVKNGGGLIVDTGYSRERSASYIPLPCPVERTSKTDFGKEWHFTSINSPITRETNFIAFSPAIYPKPNQTDPWGVSASYNESIRPWAEAVLWDQGYPLVVVGEYGRGRVVWSGLNLPYHILTYKNYMESFFLSKMIEWVSRASEKKAIETNYIVDRLNPEKVVITINNTCTGILFKENYFPNWHAHLIDANELRQNLHIYQAGPDFMYVRLPDNLKFPVKVFFEYGLRWDEIAGNTVSLTAFVFFVMYAIGIPIDIPLEYVTKKFQQLKKEIEDRWYRD